MPRVKKVVNTSVASKSGVSVPAGNVRTENLKNMQEIEEEKNVNSEKSEDKIEQKSKDDASQTTVDENTNISEHKNLRRKIPKGKTASKRKFKDVNESETEIGANLKIVDGNVENSEQDKNASTESQSSKRKFKDVNESETEIDANPKIIDGNTENSEQDKNASAEKGSSKRKFKDVNESETEMDANLKIADGNAENSEEDKNASTENPKKKTAAHPPTSEMVLESFRSLRKRNGATAEEITKYVEENYQVNINRIKPYVNKFLQKGVADGLFEQLSGSGVERKFKIKKTGKNNKGTANIKKVARKINKGAGKVKKIAERVKVDRKKTPRKETRRYVK